MTAGDRISVLWRKYLDFISEGLSSKLLPMTPPQKIISPADFNFLTLPQGEGVFKNNGKRA